MAVPLGEELFDRPGGERLTAAKAGSGTTSAGRTG